MLKDGQCCEVHLVEWKDIRFITRLHRTCISIARIIIVSTDMFSEMNFSEDVYAKGSKDPLSALGLIRCGWLIVGSTIIIHVQRKGTRIKEHRRFYFPWHRSAESRWRHVFSRRVVHLSNRISQESSLRTWFYILNAIYIPTIVRQLSWVGLISIETLTDEHRDSR